MQKWYAVKKDKNDPAINLGSHNRAEAEWIARGLGKEAYIVIYNDNGDTPVRIGEIQQEEFETKGLWKGRYM